MLLLTPPLNSTTSLIHSVIHSLSPSSERERERKRDSISHQRRLLSYSSPLQSPSPTNKQTDGRTRTVTVTITDGLSNGLTDGAAVQTGEAAGAGGASVAILRHRASAVPGPLLHNLLRRAGGAGGPSFLKWDGGKAREVKWGAELHKVIKGGNGSDDSNEEECDWFDGQWVWDEGYPLYESKDCAFLDLGFRCSQNGRPDSLYSHWRWQPNHCHLPRFSAKNMLQKLRNKRIVFVGDSIGRNQWESLLCLLSSAVSNKSSIYEINGNPITKHMGYLVFKFSEYNCTVEYYRAPFLVLQSRPPPGAHQKVHTTLKLDLMDWMWGHWKDADVLVLNTGHWWNYEKTIRSGCYFQEGNEVKMEMNVDTAYEKAIRTLFNWLKAEVNTTKTQVIFRTYAPVHFRGGDWRTGGSCHQETTPELGTSALSLKPWTKLLNPISKYSKKYSMLNLAILNITEMSLRRKDGHLSVFYLGKKGPAPLHKQDCSHWCLPGVPDAWNELLYAIFMKRETETNQKAGSMRSKRKKDGR